MDLSEGLEVRGVAPQAEFLAAVRLEQERNIVLWAAHYGLSREAYLKRVRAHMEELMEGVQPWIRIPAKVFLQVLADGRLKTMEETGLHGSADHGTQVATESYRQGRSANELAMFGISLDAPAAARPFYGYLSRDVDGQVDLDRSVLGAWGDVAVRLQPEVLPRTTVTFDDSGSMSRNIGCPSPALAPEIYSFRYMSYEGSVYNPPGSQGKFDENKYPDPLQIKGPDGPGFPSYFETHYRGGVEVARDFAEVVWGKGLEFGATSSLTEELRREAEAQLQKLGIASRDGYRQHGIKQAGLVAGSQETFELARRELEREYDRLILAFKKRVDPALREQLGANGWSGQPLERDEWTRTVHRKRR